jgi:mono/diheme cytochrome c family protein
MKLLVIGILVGLLVVAPLGAYLYVKLGFLSLATTAKPLPLEELMAHTALRESIGSAKSRPDPLPVTDENLLAGFRAYHDHCAVCHGLPGESQTVIAAGMFPPPPQLMERDMVTDDPEGATFWKISNGIRLSGMPRFDTLPETTRWQVAMLLKHADRLPPAVKAGLRQ